ncbi:O157 family O-antigen polymerase, partial [Escherichia coli]
KVLTSIIIIFQIFFVLLFYLTIINERKQQKKFIVNWELKLILVFLFVTIEIAAVVLFLKEGIPIFDDDPGGAKLRIAEGNGLYIRYIKYFGNIVVFALIILYDEHKFKQRTIIFVYFTTIALFGYRSELVLLILQYILITNILSKDNRNPKIKRIIGYFLLVGVVCSLFYLSLGQDGEQNDSYNNMLRIINRLTIEQVESVPYVVSESIKNDFFPTPELEKELKAIINRIQGIKHQDLFYGERLHKQVFGDMGANFLSVTTYGAELLVFFGFLCVFIIPLGIYIPFYLLKRMKKTHSSINCAFYSYIIMILLQYLVAGNASAFFFGPFLSV